MVESSEVIEETIVESRKGFEKDQEES